MNDNDPYFAYDSVGFWFVVAVLVAVFCTLIAITDPATGEPQPEPTEEVVHDDKDR